MYGVLLMDGRLFLLRFLHLAMGLGRFLFVLSEGGMSACVHLSVFSFGFLCMRGSAVSLGSQSGIFLLGEVMHGMGVIPLD